jgi:transposase
MNYSPEITKDIVDSYLQGLTVKQLALKYGKSEKSIIGKLAKERVYKKQVYHSKTGELPETKKEVIARLAQLLLIDPERIQGLEKAPKLELKLIEAAITKKLYPV